MYGQQPYTYGMTTALRKNDRLELRLTVEQKRAIEQAAVLSGRSVTDFSVPLLVEEATEVIRRSSELQLGAETWDAFNAILDQPAKPVSGLADLFERPSVFVD